MVCDESNTGCQSDFKLFISHCYKTKNWFLERMSFFLPTQSLKRGVWILITRKVKVAHIVMMWQKLCSNNPLFYQLIQTFLGHIVSTKRSIAGLHISRGKSFLLGVFLSSHFGSLKFFYFDKVLSMLYKLQLKFVDQIINNKTISNSICMNGFQAHSFRAVGSGAHSGTSAILNNRMT